jgi:hypothetical protein
MTLNTVDLPDERDLGKTDEAEPTGLPREREQRIVSQDEIDEADSTGAFAVTEPASSDGTESVGGDAEPDSPARI